MSYPLFNGPPLIDLNWALSLKLIDKENDSKSHWNLPDENYSTSTGNASTSKSPWKSPSSLELDSTDCYISTSSGNVPIISSKTSLSSPIHWDFNDKCSLLKENTMPKTSGSSSPGGSDTTGYSSRSEDGLYSPSGILKESSFRSPPGLLSDTSFFPVSTPHSPLSQSILSFESIMTAITNNPVGPFISQSQCAGAASYSSLTFGNQTPNSIRFCGPPGEIKTEDSFFEPDVFCPSSFPPLPSPISKDFGSIGQKSSKGGQSAGANSWDKDQGTRSGYRPPPGFPVLNRSTVFQPNSPGTLRSGFNTEAAPFVPRSIERYESQISGYPVSSLPSNSSVRAPQRPDYLFSSSNPQLAFLSADVIPLPPRNPFFQPQPRKSSPVNTPLGLFIPGSSQRQGPSSQITDSLLTFGQRNCSGIDTVSNNMPKFLKNYLADAQGQDTQGIFLGDNDYKYWGIAVDKVRDWIYVTDRNAGDIRILDPETHQVIHRFGLDLPQEFKLGRPSGLVCDNTNRRLIVCDKDNHRVVTFSLEGEFLSAFGHHGNGSGEFNYPWDVDISPNGNLIAVTDSKNHRVQFYDRCGGYLAKFSVFETNPYEYKKYFDYPRGITFDNEGRNIYVTDFNISNVLALNLGTWEKRLLSPSGQFCRPQGITMDSGGNLLVCDGRRKCIRVMTPEGEVLQSFNQVGNKSFHLPGDLDMMRDGKVAVIDLSGHVLIF